VLARKWRPANFDQVIGQTHVTQTLKNAIELNRVAHAMLFTGSRGIGKTSCARILAKALNCQNGPTVEPCGTCGSCSQIIGGTSIDVFEIDGASNNSVEQIREIRESVKFLPAHGRRKIYIIDEVHMLSTSAFNALLKTLEEPPEHVLFIFATTEPHKIPDTIISRCQRYDFKRIQERDIVDALSSIAVKEGLTVEEAALFHVAREAHGGMRDSLSLLDQVIAYCGLTITEEQARDILGIADRSVFGHLVTAILEGDSQEALTLVNTQYRRGLDLQKFAAEFVRHIRDLLVVRVVDEAAHLVDMTPDQIQGMHEQVAGIDPGRLHRMFNGMLEGAEAISRSSFPKLSLEMVLLRLCQQGATIPLADVLTGLERLEEKLNGHGIIPQRDLVPDSTKSTQIDAPQSAPLESKADDERGIIDSNHRVMPSNASSVTSGIDHETPSDLATRPPWDPVEEQPVQVTETIAPEEGDPGTSEGSTSEGSTSEGSTSEGSTSEGSTSEGSTSEGSTSEGSNSDVDAAQGDEAGLPMDDSLTTEPAPVHTESVNLSEAESVPAEPRPHRIEVSQVEPSQGLKTRPDGIGEYDDFSARPPEPQSIDQLRKLAVKPRTHLAIPREEVSLFLVTAAEPPTPIESDQNLSKSSQENAVVGSHEQTDGDLSPPMERVVVEESMTPLPVFDLFDEEEPIERFTRILDLVQSKDAFLGSELTQCLHLIQFDSQGLALTVLESYWRTIGRSAETLLRGVVQTLLGDHYPVSIDICDSKDARTESETVFERKQRLAQEHREYRRSQARHAPQVLRAQEVLNAEIVDVQLMSTPRE
jgi:DNA polymerase-3 subunit gamma/tau